MYTNTEKFDQARLAWDARNGIPYINWYAENAAESEGIDDARDLQDLAAWLRAGGDLTVGVLDEPVNEALDDAIRTHDYKAFCEHLRVYRGVGA